MIPLLRRLMGEVAAVHGEAVALTAASEARADVGEGELLPDVDLELAIDEQRHQQVRNGLVRKHLGGRPAEVHRCLVARFDPFLERALCEHTDLVQVRNVRHADEPLLLAAIQVEHQRILLIETAGEPQEP